MLITRAVLERIGGLTEEVARFFFEDEDYCMRAQAAGFQCVVVDGSYVYHAEHRSVRHLSEREKIFQRSQHWCEQKWGRRLRIAAPQFAPPAPGTPALRAWLEELVRWARRRCQLYVYAALPADVTLRDLFRSVGLVPHADVMWKAVPPRPWSRLAATGAILARQKKRFDVILAPDAGWAALMRALRSVHRAPVIFESDTDTLTQLWQTTRRSPSSS